MKLGDILEIDKSLNASDTYDRNDVLSVTDEYGLVNQIKYQGRSFAGASLSNYRITRKGQIIYTKSPLKASPFGIIKSNTYGDGILSPLYAVYNPIDDIQDSFIHFYFSQKARLNNYLLPLINKGAKNTILISDNEALQGSIIHPSLSEQAAIGDYFQHLDEAITKSESEISRLKQVKQASLQSMFPQPGETKPKLRFKGFSDDWKEVKLGEIATKSNLKNSNNEFSETFTCSAEYGIINQRDYFDHDISNTNNLGNYYVVSPNSFVYNPRISTIAPFGPILRNKTNRIGVISPLYLIFSFTNQVIYSFLDFYFSSTLWHKFMLLNGDSGARHDRFTIHTETFFQMPILLPSLPEQQKIGAYFSELNAQISLLTKKLGKLKQVKAACLSQMFV